MSDDGGGSPYGPRARYGPGSGTGPGGPGHGPDPGRGSDAAYGPGSTLGYGPGSGAGYGSGSAAGYGSGSEYGPVPDTGRGAGHESDHGARYATGRGADPDTARTYDDGRGDAGAGFDHGGGSDVRRGRVKKAGLWAAAVGALGVVGTLVGVFSDITDILKPDPTPPPVIVSPQPQPQPKDASIVLTYTSDNVTCSPVITVTVGGTSATPNSNRFSVDHVALGSQDYVIAGNLTCGQVYYCTMSGSGKVDVADGRSYAILWEDLQNGTCSAGLRG